MKKFYCLCILLALTLAGCSTGSTQTEMESSKTSVSDALPLPPPMDLCYDEGTAPIGSHVFVMHSDLGMEGRYSHRGIIQVAVNVPIKSHRAFTNVNGFTKSLVSWVKHYRTQSHIEVVFSRVSLPPECYIHIEVVLESGKEEKLYFLHNRGRLTQCRSPY